MTKLNNNFMKRATKITSFNLTAADFQTLEYKREIQTLYQTHMFGSFDPDLALKNITVTEYNKLVNLLKKDDKSQYEKLHNLPLKGVGPAEGVLYLLTQNGHLGGGSSAGVDLINMGKKYEVKAVKWKSVKKEEVSDFKLGGNIPGMSQLEVKIQKLAYQLGLTNNIGAPEISEGKFKEMKAKEPKLYNELDQEYAKMAKGYFANHETIFIQTDPKKSDFGEIIAIKKVKESDIRMERFTSKSIKPLIKI